jgi:hypothetical protein
MAGAKARYAYLIKEGYAKAHMVPPPGDSDGLTPLPDGPHTFENDQKDKPPAFTTVSTVGAREIDASHLVLFGQMASDFRNGVKP